MTDMRLENVAEIDPWLFTNEARRIGLSCVAAFFATSGDEENREERQPESARHLRAPYELSQLLRPANAINDDADNERHDDAENAIGEQLLAVSLVRQDGIDVVAFHALPLRLNFFLSDGIDP